MNTSVWKADLGNGMYRNPILYADYSDPDAIRVGDNYFMIASSFCNAPGVPLLHSKDLVNWKVVNYVWDEVPEKRYKSPVHGCGAWAPSIRFHNGTYYAFIPMPDEGIYVSTTKDPFGKWDKPYNLRPGAGWIDPCPFWDDDGRAYMVAGVAKSRIGYKSVLHVVEMTADAKELIGEEVKVFDGNENDQVTIEGPKFYKRNGYYYIFAPAGGVKTGWQTVLRSRNVFGPYEYKVVMRQGDSPVNGPHQGAWVDTPSGQNWFLHFQDVYAAGRIVHLQPMTWLDNDWPVIGIAKPGNDYGEPVMEYSKPDVGNTYTPCEPDSGDDFTGSSLGMQWQWNANPQKSWYKLNEPQHKGITLNAVSQPDCESIADLPNLLLQKWPAPEFCCTTAMDYSRLENGECAGIVNMGMSYAALAIEKNDDGFRLITYTGRQKFSGVNWSSIEEKNTVEAGDKISGGKIFFKYDVTCTGRRDLSEKEKDFPLETVTMSYSFDGINYIDVLSFDAVPGRWVGVKMGILAAAYGTSLDVSSQECGKACFEYFNVEAKN